MGARRERRGGGGADKGALLLPCSRVDTRLEGRGWKGSNEETAQPRRFIIKKRDGNEWEGSRGVCSVQSHKEDKQRQSFFHTCSWHALKNAAVGASVRGCVRVIGEGLGSYIVFWPLCIICLTLMLFCVQLYSTNEMASRVFACSMAAVTAVSNFISSL